MGQALTKKNQNENSYEIYSKSKIANFDKVSSPTQNQKLDYNSELVRAFTLLKNQQYENAIQLIDNLLKRSPNLADAQYLKGLAYLGSNKLEQALYFCQKATQLDKKHSKAMAEIGNIYILNKKYHEALDVFSKLIEMNEKSFEGYFGMAFVSTIINDYEKAETCYEKALQLKEKDKGALLNYGHLQVKQKKYQSALELYFQALKVEPKYLEAIQSICNLFIIEKNYEKLHLFCDQHLENSIPQIRMGLLNCKSQAYFSQKLYDKSINLCKEVLTLDQKNNEALFGIAMSLFNLNQLNQSLDYFQKIIDINPQEIRALKMIVKIHSTLQQYAQLKQFCDQLIAIDYTDYSTYFFRGIAFMQQQNYLQAINDFNQVIMHDQSNFMAIKHKGFCLSMLNMFNQAIQCYDQIINYILDLKEKSILLLEKGVCHLKLEQSVSAKSNFDEAMELDPNNQQLKLKIANIARDNKNYDFSIRLYDELINQNGKIPLYHLEKAQLYEKRQDYLNAKILYDEIIEQNDQNFEYFLKRSKIKIQLQEFEEALQDLFQGLKLDNKQSELYFELGQIYFIQQSFSEAANMFQKACTLNNKIEKYHIKYAIALQMQQANDKAIQHLVFVLQKHPDFDDCRDVLESINSQSTRNKEYIKVFSFILISVIQEGVVNGNQNKQEIQDSIKIMLEKHLKTRIPKINKIFDIVCSLLRNLYNIKIVDSQKDLQKVSYKLYKYNLNNIEKLVKYLIEISKKIAFIQVGNFMQEEVKQVEQIQREIDNLGLQNELNEFKNQIGSAAILDCLDLLRTLMINSNRSQLDLKNKIEEILINDFQLNDGRQ
ncbi:unnamed protein product [Paramecium sonneborni]|uniref:Tetratricopeptide repeat protein n=1 Tax=Paramecium sonneborni TaxID=65129 RepID=A0A8S1M4C5_9CILI|nr:unnamed protein product [Paramecium sonneborni]